MANHNFNPQYNKDWLPPPPPPPPLPGAMILSSNSSVFPYNAATQQRAPYHAHSPLGPYNMPPPNYRHSNMSFGGNSRMMQQGYPGPGNGYSNETWRLDQSWTSTTPSQAEIDKIVEKVRLEEHRKHQETIARYESTIQGLTRVSATSLQNLQDKIQMDTGRIMELEDRLEKSTTESSSSRGGLRICSEEAEVAAPEIPDIPDKDLQEEQQKWEKIQKDFEESEKKGKIIEKENAQLKEEIEQLRRTNENVSQLQESLKTATQNLESLQKKKNETDSLLQESEKKLKEAKETFSRKLDEISSKSKSEMQKIKKEKEEGDVAWKEQIDKINDVVAVQAGKIRSLESALDEEKKKADASDAQYMKEKKKNARLAEELHKKEGEIQKKTNNEIVKVTRGVQTIRRDSESLEASKRNVEVQTFPSSERLLHEHNGVLQARIRELSASNAMLRGELREMRRSNGGKAPLGEDKKTNEPAKSELKKRNPRRMVAAKDLVSSTSVKPVKKRGRPPKNLQMIANNAGPPTKKKMKHNK